MVVVLEELDMNNVYVGMMLTFCLDCSSLTGFSMKIILSVPI